MTRSAARRHGAVQADKSLPPAPPPFDNAPDDPYAAPAASITPWYWRFVMFLWLTSFVILLMYEWLAGIFKSWAN